jgi:hypothetical protein
MIDGIYPKQTLVSALQPLPSLKHDTCFAPRMLTPSEIAWLRQHKQAVTAELRRLMKETGLLNRNRQVA